MASRSPIGMQRVSRRSLLRGALGTATGLSLAGGLAGCGSPLGAGLFGTELSPGTLTYWNLFGGGDGVRMQTMESTYADAHGGPDSLQAATFTWGNPYYTKLSLCFVISNIYPVDPLFGCSPHCSVAFQKELASRIAFQ